MLAFTVNPGIFIPSAPPEAAWIPIIAILVFGIISIICVATIETIAGQPRRFAVAMTMLVAAIACLGFSFTDSINRSHADQAASVAHQTAVADWLHTDYGVTVKASSIPLNPGDKLVQITGELDAKPVIVGFSSNKAGDLLAFDGNAKLFTKVD